MNLRRFIRILAGMVIALVLGVGSWVVLYPVNENLNPSSMFLSMCLALGAGNLGWAIGGAWWVPLIPFVILSLMFGAWGLYLMDQGSCIAALIPFGFVFIPGMLVGIGVAIGSLVKWILPRVKWFLSLRGVQRGLLTLAVGLPLLVISFIARMLHLGKLKPLGPNKIQ